MSLTLKNIPIDWRVYPLGDIANFSQGIQVGTEKHISKLIDGYQRFIRIIDYTQPNNNDIRYIPIQGERYFANAEDIIMIRYGTPGVIGRGIEGIIANNMFKIAFNQLVINDFAEHFFKFSETIKKINDGSASSTMPAINFGFLKKLPFVVPPLPEQQKIAEILSTVDAKIEVIEQQITETQALKKGLMQRLLTKGIGHREFKDSPLGEIPKSWEVSSLESHSAFITKGSTPTTYGFKWEESGVQFLRSECVSPNGFILSGAMFISEEANNAMERSKIKGGDILMTITGNVGRVCIYPMEYLTGNINQHIARIRITDNKLSSQFVFQFLSQSTQIQDYLKITTGQAYPQLSLKQVRETKIPLPSLNEQNKIAEILGIIDEKLEVLSEKKTHHQELKQGLMQQLLTGKIRVKTNNTVTA